MMSEETGLSIADVELDTISALLVRAARSGTSAGLSPLEMSRPGLAYPELLVRARRVAHGLHERGVRPGDPVVLCVRDSVAFVSIFWGCVVAGAVPAPVPFPDIERGPDSENVRRAIAVARALGSWIVCAGPAHLDALERMLSGSSAQVVDEAPLLARAESPGPLAPFVAARATELAVLQYSSGSTSIPKGVALTHRNILSSIAAMAQAEGWTGGDRLLSWMPYFHDFGLFGCHLKAVFCAAPEFRLEPVYFARHPSAWLDAVGTRHATVSFATPTALRLLTQELRRRSRQRGPRPDLCSLRFLGIGAEMIPRSIVSAFLDAAQPFGLRPEALHFGYGLAENTLSVTTTPLASGAAGFAHLDRDLLLRHGRAVHPVSNDAERISVFAKLGPPLAGVRVEIRGDDGAELPPLRSGRVWISGESVMQRYYRDPGATEEVRRGDWLDTGDVGFLDTDGELVLTGREKELIIQNGRNIHPHDIEQVGLSAASGGARDCFVAAEYQASRGCEDVILFIVLEPAASDRQKRLTLARIRQAVQRAFEIDVRTFVALRGADVSRTSSGKVKRRELVERFRAGLLGMPLEPVSEAGAPMREIEERVGEAWARSLRMPAAGSGLAGDYFELGGDSLRAIELQGTLERHFGLKLPASFCHRYRHLRDQADYLWHATSGRTAPASDLEQLVARTCAWELGCGTDELDTARRLLEQCRDMSSAARAYAELSRVFGVEQAALEAENSVQGLTAVIRERTALPPSAPFGLMQFQETLYFHRQGFVTNEPSRLSCYIVYRVRLRGEFDPKRLEGALAALLEQCPMLRAYVDESGEQPQLRVAPWPLPVPLLVHDLRELDPAERERQLAEHWELDQDHRFALDRPPLLRARAALMAEDTTQLTLHVDHMLIDGYGFLELVVALLRRYDNPDGELPSSAPLGFGHYVQLEHWRRRTREYETWMARHLARFEELAPRFCLPMRRNPATLDRVRFRTHHCLLPAELMDGLSAMARRNPEVSLNSLLLAGFFKLMSVWSNQEDLIINMPIFNREGYFPDARAVLGSFIDVFPVRLRSRASTPLLEMATAIEQFNRRLLEYPVSSVDLARRLSERSNVRGSLSSVIFSNSIHLIDEKALVFRELHLEGLPEVHTGAPGTYLDLVCFNVADAWCFDWNYVVELFEPRFVATLAEQYERILEQLAGQEATGSTPFQVQSVYPPGWEQTLGRLNSTTRSYDRRTVYDRVCESAERAPRSVALTDGEAQWSYAELVSAARELSQLLEPRQVRGEFVAVLMGRCADLLISQLAALGAGAAYVPLDPSYPAERLRFMIADSRARVVLTHAEHLPLLQGVSAEVLVVDDAAAPSPHPSAAADLRPLPPPTAGDHAAGAWMYMIYTSGSTGRPKGVPVSHQNFANFIEHVLSTFVRGPEEQFALVTSHAFDMTLASNWGPLLCGATLHIQPDRETRDVERLLEFLERRRVSWLNVTPSHLSLLVRALPLCASKPRLVPHLRVLLGGETINTHDLNRWLEHYPSHEFVNEYGPTEVTVASTFFPIPKGSREHVDLTQVPIGAPIANTRVYVLGKDGQPCLPNVVGDLYLAGDGVAGGYWGDEEKTRAAFLPDLHAPSGARMYRTGDLARFDDAGQLVFIGRNDNQVNLHGYRIELAEIESALLESGRVREAVVDLVGPAGEEWLLAACVPITPPWNEPALRAFLAERLPSHMIPRQFVPLDTLPLTASGKLDRNALKESAALGLDRGRAASERGRPARGALEEALQRIWSDVLGAAFGVEDDFGDQGVSSLRVLRLVQRVRDELSLPISLGHVFEHRNIAALAQALGQCQPAAGDRGPFLLLARPKHPRFRIVALPYAGGNASAYSSLAARVPDAEFWSARYPGHEGSGASASSIEELATALYAALPQDDHLPTVYFGISFGAYVAFELARRQGEGGRPAAGLVLASATPPGQRDRIMALLELAPGDLERALAVSASNMPELSPPERERYLTLLRQDTTAMLAYTFAPLPSGAVTRCCLVVGQAEDDPIVARRQEDWRPYVGDAELHVVPGGHLFGDAGTPALAELLATLGRRAS